MLCIGFIAQDVKEVIPEAVSFQTEILPDEMRRILDPQWDNLDLTIPDLDMSGNNITGKCKFYVSNDLSGNDEVCKVIDCVKDASGNNTNQFQFDKEYNNIFLYGKEVDDFHTLDNNQIFALHHGAIQELSRRGDTLSKQLSETTTSNIDKYTILSDKLDTLEVKNSILVGKNKSLKDEMATIRSDNINLKQRMVDMEAKINDILSKL